MAFHKTNLGAFSGTPCDMNGYVPEVVDGVKVASKAITALADCNSSNTDSPSGHPL